MVCIISMQGNADPHQRRRLLLVDSDINIQATLVALLGADFLVDTASTASEGFRYLAASPPDLVILDIVLPDLDGLYFVHALRVQQPACPVLVLTAADQGEILREMAILGITGFYRKPVPVCKVLQQINALLPLPTPLRRFALSSCRPLSEAVDHICCHYAQPLTIQAVAKAIGISCSHLAFLFRDMIGMTAKAYLLKIRLEVAKRLLIYTDHTLDSIAARVGFYDASHLSRVFRHHVGSWPGAYRHRQQGLLVPPLQSPDEARGSGSEMMSPSSRSRR